MTDTRNAGSTVRKDDDLADTVATLGSSLARVSATVVSLPFYLLPQQARHEAIESTTELFNAVGTLHLNLVRAAISGLGAATRELNRAINEPGAPATRGATRVPIETSQPVVR